MDPPPSIPPPSIPPPSIPKEGGDGDEVQVQSVDPRVLNAALEYVTTKVLEVSDGGTQALGAADFSKLDALKLGSANRNVSAEWVNDLVRTMFMELHERRERTMLTLCIDLREVQAALEDPEARAAFRAVILDGQHRWTAMRAIRDAYPGTNIPFWVTVHLVRTDEEQQDIITRLDRRSPITDVDRVVMEARARFKEALMLVVGPANIRRHAFHEAADHPVLREPRVCAALTRVATVDAMRDKLARLSVEYEPRYRACVKGDLGGGPRAIIRTSQIYFFMADPREWVPHMLLGDALPAASAAPKKSEKEKAAEEGAEKEGGRRRHRLEPLLVGEGGPTRTGT